MKNPSQVSLRTVYTVCFGVLSVVGLVYAVTRTQIAITLTLLAAMLAITLHHLVAALGKRGIPAWLAVLLVIVVVAGAGTAFGVLVVAPAVNQAQGLAGEIPKLVERLRQTDFFKVLAERVDSGAIVDRLSGSAPAIVLGLVGTLASLIAFGITILVMSIFMMIFGGGLITKALSYFEEERRARLRRLLDGVYRSVGGYVSGIILIALINMAFCATFLGILGVPFWLALAIASGISSMIPYIGELIVATVVALIALGSLGGWHMLAVVIYFVAYGQLEGNLFNPLIHRRNLSINPLIVTLSILFLGEMAGLLGAFLAIPLVASVQIVLKEVLKAPPSSAIVAPPPSSV